MAGYSVVETDNPDSLGEGPAKFGAYFDFEIVPVADIGESVRLLSEGIDFRKAAKGSQSRSRSSRSSL